MHLKQKKKNQKKNKLEKIKDDYKTFFKYIEDELKSISYKLFEKHFHFASPLLLLQNNYMSQKIKIKTMS